MDKMIRTAKRLALLNNIVFIICVVIAAILSTCAISVIFIDDEYLIYNLFRIPDDSWKNFLPIGTSAYADLLRKSIMAPALLLGIHLLFVCFCSRSIRNILIPMTEGRPFQKKACKSLNRLAWFSLAVGLLVESAGFIVDFVMYQQNTLENTFRNVAMQIATLEYRPNLFFLLLFVVLQLTSYVFRYGQQLQQLEDETL